MEEKVQRLEDILRAYHSILVAFSGGVDSSFLLYMAVRTLGAHNVLAVTADSPTYQREHLKEAGQFALECHAEQIIVHTEEMKDVSFVENSARRCYFCKAELFKKLSAIADERSIRTIVEGSNADDASDYRPGFGAIDEYGVRSPLKEAGLTKGEIRALSRRFSLPSWDKPQSACLSSRIPFGVPIDTDKLAKIEQSEAALTGLGFRFVRVRLHGDTARIELEADEMHKLADPSLRRQVTTQLKKIGFHFIVLDLECYRPSGLSFNKTDQGAV
ncbi:MAG: ATP-dependent sacrificial sulfur transferase LarE [Candidatus Omnitrophica bacterium]|nr:ATP-dependent sacrificial sulfur transferase LarE [Candidatus Omnitrophota bacterium]